MKMILEQAIRKRLGNRLEIFGVQLHEIAIVAGFDKDIFAIDPAAIDMKELVGYKGGEFLHGDMVSKIETFEVLKTSKVWATRRFSILPTLARCALEFSFQRVRRARLWI